MAVTAELAVKLCADHEGPLKATEMGCIKTLTKSAQLTSIPSHYACITGPEYESSSVLSADDTIPTIDFSLLTSNDPDQRSKAIQNLRIACQDWGFFTVVNHGVPASLMNAIIEATDGFFNLTEEEKREYEGKHVLDPIRCGTSFNAKVDKIFFWRDFLKVFVHPEFHFPNKPPGFSELAREYCRRSREVARELLKGISESLGLEACHVDKTLNLESGLVQIFVGNVYPPCPEPEMAMGMPPHSDHGLLTLLIQNQVGGLQLLHDGQWVAIGASRNHPYSFLVNIGDHIEILSNGKYKSVLHRAAVNDQTTRISIALAHGPSLGAVVGPAKELIARDGSPAFLPMRYGDYLKLQQGNQLDGKAALDRVRVPAG